MHHLDLLVDSALRSPFSFRKEKNISLHCKYQTYDLVKTKRNNLSEETLQL